MTLEKSVQIFTLVIFGVPVVVSVIVGIAYVLSSVIMWGISG